MQNTQIQTEENTLKELIIASLEDDKAENIVVIDLKGKSDMADYLVIATGRADRHVAAIADHIMDKLKVRGLSVAVEGMKQCDWVLVDAFDIIVHIFRQDVREIYNLEKMWQAELPKQ